MSVKLHELQIQSHNGELVICKKNKRNNISDYVNITKPILKRVIDILTTNSDQFIHQKIVDPETNETRHFKITCTLMTPEEVSAIKRNNEKRREQGLKNIKSLCGCLLNSLANKPVLFNESFFESVKQK